ERTVDAPEIEIRQNPDHGRALGQPCLIHDLPGRFDERRVEIHALVATGVEMADEMHARAERTTTDVKQALVRFKPQEPQQLELELAARAPRGRLAAKMVLVLTRCNLRGVQVDRAVVASHLSTCP